MTLARRPRPKYGNRKTEVDGITFDSAKEARRYQELKMLEKASVIRDLKMQPAFVLYVSNGDGEVSLGIYRADFEYEACDHANGHSGFRRVVEDVKGFRTPLYRWKKKHVEAQYGIRIIEV